MTPISENDTIIELTEEEEWYGVTSTDEHYDTSTDNIENYYDENDDYITAEEQETEGSTIKTTTMIA